ncbi:unnamed protein product, partial [Mesorhabditis belari]|uniref:CUB domain-containing protein n=1 Tax=Mesorhabditis belari TaxID=2138241 RepID=A0AAF3J914_9BILA
MTVASPLVHMDCTKVNHLSKGRDIIKSPNYPQQYPSPTNCTWIIDHLYSSYYGPGAQITIEEFETDSQFDQLKISETVSGDGHSFWIPKAVLKGSRTSDTLKYVIDSARLPAKLEFIGRTNTSNNFRFHLDVERGYYHSCNRGYYQIGKKMQTIEIVIGEAKRCPTLMLAPEGQTIELKFDRKKEANKFFLIDLKELQELTNFDDCLNTTYVTEGIYRSFTNKVIFGSCQGKYESISFEATARSSRCECQNTEIKLDVDEVTQEFGTFEPYTHYELCEKIACQQSIKLELRPNLTHTPIIILDYHTKALHPATFNVEAPNFPSISGKVYNYTSVRHGSISLATDCVNVVIQKGAVKFHVSAHYLPKECTCFRPTPGNVLEFFDQSAVHRFNFPHYCAPMDCWMVIKNDKPGKILAFNMSSSGVLDTDEHLSLIFDGKVQRGLPLQGAFTTQDFGEGAKNVSTYFLHLKIPSEDAQLNNETIKNEMLNIEISLKWKDPCICNNQKRTLKRGEIFHLTSPGFEQNSSYCDYLRCAYDFLAPADTKIQLNITFYDIPDLSDSLFYVTNKGRYFLSNVTMVDTGVNALQIRFHTDETDVGRGFEIAISLADACSKSSGWMIVFYLFASIIVVGFLAFFGYKIKNKTRFSNQIFVRFKNPEHIQGFGQPEMEEANQGGDDL